MVENNSNVNNKSQSEDKKELKKRKIIIRLIILLIVFMLGTIIFGRYMSTKKTNIASQVAKMVCEMEVEPSEEDKETLNPYCTVKVKNYNSEDKITETNIRFVVEVKAKGNATIPQYYWKDAEGRRIAESTVIGGYLKNGVKETKEYTIVFMNPGEENITKKVEFNLVAVQAMEEQN